MVHDTCVIDGNVVTRHYCESHRKYVLEFSGSGFVLEQDHAAVLASVGVELCSSTEESQNRDILVLHEELVIEV